MQIGTAARCAMKRSKTAERSLWALLLGDRHVTIYQPNTCVWLNDDIHHHSTPEGYFCS